MKTSGREKRAEISLAFHVFGVLFVYFSFWHLSAKGCRQNVWPSCLLFVPICCHYFPFFLLSLCISFPCHFLSISSSLLSTPCYFILLFSLYISPCLFHMIFLLFSIWLPSIVFLSLSLCISHFICILYYLKAQKFKKTMFAPPFEKKNLLEKCLIIENPQNTKW